MKYVAYESWRNTQRISVAKTAGLNFKMNLYGNEASKFGASSNTPEQRFAS
jgi:hypothetical protein